MVGVDPQHPLIVRLNEMRQRLLFAHKHEMAHGVSMALIAAYRWLQGRPTLEPTPSDFARLEDDGE